jgi:hypothetical protein
MALNAKGTKPLCDAVTRSHLATRRGRHYASLSLGWSKEQGAWGKDINSLPYALCPMPFALDDGEAI